MVSPEVFYFTYKQKLKFAIKIVNLVLLKPNEMNNNQQKKRILQKAINSYNSWCKEFKVGSMCVKNELRRYVDPSEFDTEKFKKLIKTKSW